MLYSICHAFQVAWYSSTYYMEYRNGHTRVLIPVLSMDCNMPVAAIPQTSSMLHVCTRVSTRVGSTCMLWTMPPCHHATCMHDGVTTSQHHLTYFLFRSFILIAWVGLSQLFQWWVMSIRDVVLSISILQYRYTYIHVPTPVLPRYTRVLQYTLGTGSAIVLIHVCSVCHSHTQSTRCTRVL